MPRETSPKQGGPTADTTADTMPTLDDVASMLENDVYYQVLKELRETRYISLDEDAGILKLNTGGVLEVVFTLGEDGLIGCDSLTTSLVPLRATDNSVTKSPFRSAWYATFQQTKDSVAKRLERRMGLDPWDAVSSQNPDPAHQAMTKLAETQEYDTLLDNTARGVRATLDHRYVTNPNRTGYGLLHRLIGKERVSQALAIAGSKASLYHLNLIHRNTEAFTLAHQANPNAVIYWFTNHQFHDAEPAALTPETIISNAKLEFTWDPRNHSPGYERVWETFCNLNQRAVNHVPHSAETLENVAWEIEAVGVQPTYSALTTLLKMRSLHPYPQGFIHAFVRESDARTRDRSKTQAQLVDQFKNLAGCFLELDPDNVPSRQAVDALTRRAEQPGSASLPWDKWTEDLPKELTPTPAARKKSPRKEVPATRPQVNLKDRLAEILESPQGSALRRLLTGAVTLHLVPRREITLNVKGQEQPVLRLTKQPNGTIRVQTDRYWPHHRDLSTDRDQVEQWTSDARELQAGTMTALTMDFLEKNQDRLGTSINGPMPSRRAVAKALLAPDYTQNTPSLAERLHLIDEDAKLLPEQLALAVQGLVDPEIQDLSAHMAPKRPLTIHKYNMLVTIGPFAEHLRRTNPGALEWALTYTSPHEDINHPGQVITLARDSMRKSGLDPRNWKFAATMEAGAMTSVTSQNGPGAAAVILNIMARANAVPSEKVIAYASQICNQWAIKDTVWEQVTPDNATVKITLTRGELPGTNIENISTALALLFKESANTARQAPPETCQPDLVDQAASVIDYVNMVTNQLQGRVRSTTWQGLMSRSERWHRQRRLEPIKQQWQNKLNRQQNRYRAWSSLMDITQDGPYAFVPLTDERQLYQESLVLGHCVINYGTRCENGGSRIFSVEQDDNKVATSEIQLVNNSWQEIQTRGVQNHPVTQDIKDAAARLALAYSQAYQNTSIPGHPGWWIDAATLEVTSPPSQEPGEEPGNHIF